MRGEPNDYLKRINRAIDLVYDHLGEDLPLSRLAQAAHFSPFHFHRLFRSLTGECVKEFTLRLRLERALQLLKTSPRLSLKEIAAATGFASPAVFSRAFRRAYERTPSEARRPGFQPRSTDKRGVFRDSRFHLQAFPADEPALPVQVELLPAMQLAYLRVPDPYQSPRLIEAFRRLLAWAQASGLSAENAQLLGMQQEDPEVTPLEKCRYDLAIALPPGAPEPPADFSLRRLPARHFALIRCQGELPVIERAIHYLFKSWLPRSSWQPAHAPAMEWFHRWPRDPTETSYDLSVCVPLAKLR